MHRRPIPQPCECTTLRPGEVQTGAPCAAAGESCSRCGALLSAETVVRDARELLLRSGVDSDGVWRARDLALRVLNGIACGRCAGLLGALVLLALVFTSVACTNETTEPAQPRPAPRHADLDYAAAPTDPHLFEQVISRWNAAGLPVADGCALPREVLADDQMFEELCGVSGPQACQTHDSAGPLLVIIDGWQLERTRMARVRAHEMAHWLAECTGTLTPRQNFDHALANVWWSEHDGDDFVLAPWVQ